MWLTTVFLVYSKMEFPSETESISSRFEPYGAENSAFLSTLIASHPRSDLLRNFLVILRYWAKVKGVSSRGNSINGYTLTLMAMVYLQNQGEQPKIRPQLPPVKYFGGEWVTVGGWLMPKVEVESGTKCLEESETPEPKRSKMTEESDETSDDDIVGALLGFFRFYARFPYSTSVVCPYLGRPVDRNDLKDEEFLRESFGLYSDRLKKGEVPGLSVSKPLCVQDPFEHAVNTSANVTAASVAGLASACTEAVRVLREGDCTVGQFLKWKE